MFFKKDSYKEKSITSQFVDVMKELSSAFKANFTEASKTWVFFDSLKGKNEYSSRTDFYTRFALTLMTCSLAWQLTVPAMTSLKDTVKTKTQPVAQNLLTRAAEGTLSAQGFFESAGCMAFAIGVLRIPENNREGIIEHCSNTTPFPQIRELIRPSDKQQATPAPIF